MHCRSNSEAPSANSLRLNACRRLSSTRNVTPDSGLGGHKRKECSGGQRPGRGAAIAWSGRLLRRGHGRRGRPVPRVLACGALPERSRRFRYPVRRQRGIGPRGSADTSTRGAIFPRCPRRSESAWAWPSVRPSPWPPSRDALGANSTLPILR